MKKIILHLGFLIALLAPFTSFGQSTTYIAHYNEPSHIKKDTLTDSKGGEKFIIDKNRIYITAVDKTGKQLWKTDPVGDNKIEEYRVKRPVIVYFALGTKGSGNDEVIYISYNNSQFGYLDEKSGTFHFEGQD